MTRGWLMIAAADPASNLLLQYGAVGVVAVLALAAVRVLYTRMTAQVDRETARADRLEDELRKLNETVRTEYITTLATTVDALKQANEAIADARAAVRRAS